MYIIYVYFKKNASSLYIKTLQNIQKCFAKQTITQKKQCPGRN